MKSSVVHKLILCAIVVMLAAPAAAREASPDQSSRSVTGVIRGYVDAIFGKDQAASTVEVRKIFHPRAVGYAALLDHDNPFPLDNIKLIFYGRFFPGFDAGGEYANVPAGEGEDRIRGVIDGSDEQIVCKNWNSLPKGAVRNVKGFKCQISLKSLAEGAGVTIHDLLKPETRDSIKIHFGAACHGTACAFRSPSIPLSSYISMAEGKDPDFDFVPDEFDNCPSLWNSAQQDLDQDLAGDFCDEDDDGDAVLDEADNCPKEANPDQDDADGDGRGDACDHCPSMATPDQQDSNQNHVGDACE